MNKQITEDFVSYEIAKLLKEKGFNEDSWFHYDADGDIVTRGYRLNMPEDIPAWTHQIAMKWLRKNHNIHCDIGYDDCDWFWNIVSVDKKVPAEDRPLFIKNGLAGYKSYEEACEAAIKYCLENLI